MPPPLQKVLVVDDEPRNLRIIFETLSDLVELKAASDGAEALSLLDAFKPDLLLLDVMMPNMDGFEVCRRIKSGPHADATKVILVSGKAMLDERLRGYECGADDYMTKPFEPAELLAKSKVFLRLNAIEAKLTHSAKMAVLGEMAGGIGHEVNNPLAITRGYVDMLRSILTSAAPDTAKALRIVEKIEQATTRAVEIVRGLLTFARNSADAPATQHSVREILDMTLRFCVDRFYAHKTELKVDVDVGLLIDCRPTEISQVLLNLISNAFDAVQGLESKWVKVTARASDGLVLISVEDSGTGIPADVVAKMMDPFFSTKEPGKGTGLGLSISKNLVEAHHGRLAYDASGPNTRFVLEIPVSAARESIRHAG